MTVVDTSVLVSVATGEADASAFEKVLRWDKVVVATTNLQEAGMVLTAATDFEKAMWFLHRLTQRVNVQVVAFTDADWRVGTQAFDRYGKGRHPARLNFGDCMSYAVAKVRGEPLLFKGKDFGHTDLDLHPASVIVP